MVYIVVSLILGIIAGAAFFNAVPAFSWLPVILALIIGAYFVKRKHLTFALLFLAMFSVGCMRVSQATSDLEAELLFNTTEIPNGSNPKFLNSNLSSLNSNLSSLNSHLSTIFSSYGMDAESAAIANAMTLGNKRFITKDIRNTYSASGASHALALSGMHLTIIFALLMLVLFKLPQLILMSPRLLTERIAIRTHLSRGKDFPQWAIKVFYHTSFLNDLLPVRRVLTTLILVTIWAYTLLVGMSPSIVRASTMLTIVGIGTMLSRPVNIIDSLSLAAFIILIISPLSFFDAGFQMSYLAVLGIAIYLRPLMSIIKAKKKLIKWVIGIIALTISAQILVLPLVAYYFHQLPCYGILTSLIIAVTTTVIVWLGIIVLMFHALSVFLSTFAQFLTSFIHEITTIAANALEAVIHMQDQSLAFITNLPHSTINELSISTSQLILIYIIIASVSIIFRKLKLL